MSTDEQLLRDYETACNKSQRRESASSIQRNLHGSNEAGPSTQRNLHGSTPQLYEAGPSTQRNLHGSTPQRYEAGPSTQRNLHSLTPQRYEAGPSSQKSHESSRSQRKQRLGTHESRMAHLTAHVNHCIEGFTAANAISYRGSSDKLTFSRPGLMCNFWLEDKEDEFFPDNKALWPVLSDRDMRRPFPKKVTGRPHRINDPNFQVPPSKKKVRQPEPVLPKGNKDGVKLRNPDDILRELQAKKNGTLPAVVVPPPRVEKAPINPIDSLPESIKGVLQSINDSNLLQQRNQKQSSLNLNKSKNSLPPLPSSSSSVRTPMKRTIPKLSPLSALTPVASTSRPNKLQRSNVGEPKATSYTSADRRLSIPKVSITKPPQQPRAPNQQEIKPASIYMSKKPMPATSSSSSIYANKKPISAASGSSSIYASKKPMSAASGSSSIYASKKPMSAASGSSSVYASKKPMSAASGSSSIYASKKPMSAASGSSSIYASKKPMSAATGSSSVYASKKPMSATSGSSSAYASKKPMSATSGSSSAFANEKLMPATSGSSSVRGGRRSMSVASSSSSVHASDKPISVASDSPLMKSHPRFSGKSTPVGSKTPESSTNSIDFIEARKYLFQEPDEYEIKTLTPLVNYSRVTRRPRPSLFIHISDCLPELTEAVHGMSAARAKYEKAEKARKAKAAAEKSLGKSKSSKNMVSRKEAKPTAVIKKSLKQKEVVAPKRKAREDEPIIKSTHPAPITADFLRSTRIPKRQHSEIVDADLEEGEMRSPSPVPTSKRKKRNVSTPASDAFEVPAPPVVSKPEAKQKPARNASLSREVPMARQKPVASTSSASEERRRQERPPRATPPSSTRRSQERDRSLSPSRRTVRREVASPSARTRSRSPVSRESSARRMPKTPLSQKAKIVASTTTSEPSVSSRPAEDKISKKPAVSLKPVVSSKPTVNTETSKTSVSLKPAVNTESSKPSVSSNTASSKSSVSSKSAVNIASALPPVSATPARTSTASTAPKSAVSSGTNYESMEQFKIFQIMFSKLATKTKHRGDARLQTKAGIMDHFHALCSYMLSFYYSDKLNRHSIRETAITWKTLFPFCENLLRKLDANGMSELRPLCLRIISLIRFYLFDRLKSTLPPQPPQEHAVNTRTYLELSGSLFREQLKAMDYLKSSETYMGYTGISSNFPETFHAICKLGDFSSGIVLGGEQGNTVSPMFPFEPYKNLNIVAIAARSLISEYAKKNNIAYTPLTKPEEFM